MTTARNDTGTDAGPERAHAELLDVSQVAAMTNCSVRTVYRLADAGKMPRPIKLGSLVRWRSNELRRWIEGGCLPCQAEEGGTP